MTGTQYKNVAQWTLANGAAEASESAAAAKAIFDNMGVPFPAGSCGEILLTLMSEDYMGWRACTHLEAQEYANAGTAAVGIDGEHVVVILPEEGEDLVGAVVQANATSYARQASDISTAERITMQFYANSKPQTSSWLWLHYANLVTQIALGVKDKPYSYFTASIRDGITFTPNKWCVDFVRWCFKKAGVYRDDIIKATSSSGTLRNWFRDSDDQSGTLYKGYLGIRPGDIVFTCDHVLKDKEVFINAENPAHTCIAISNTYYKDGEFVVDTINGCWSDAVQTHTFTCRAKICKPLVARTDIKSNAYDVDEDYVGWYAHPYYERAGS